MSDISKVDKNFLVDTTIDKKDVKYYNIEEGPFKIYGVYREGNCFRRMPENVAKSVSDGVWRLHTCAAGGKVRFKTDSKYVAINAKLINFARMPHFPFTGSSGFDMYADNVYVTTFVPPLDTKDNYDSVCNFSDNSLREITINFPLYTCVESLYIGLEENAKVYEAEPYKNLKPVVYYGSSITQGGCASRPGMSYQEIISRSLNLDYINLGFSGNAKGEDEIADYIKNLNMSLFVYDYDHNAPSVEHLKNTHERMFKIIRKANPDLPIIFMNRPKFYLKGYELDQYEIIKTTYENALKEGDKNIYFVDNKALTKLCKNEGTVDNCHPTDFGFNSMAEALIKVIKDIDIF